jgi:hypothetical protein
MKNGTSNKRQYPITRKEKMEMTLRHAAKAVSAAGMARLCLVGAVLALVFVTTATELRAEGIMITNNYEVANSYPSRLYGYIQNGGCLRWDFFATKGQTVQMILYFVLPIRRM